jgi:hypothetical protein
MTGEARRPSIRDEELQRIRDLEHGGRLGSSAAEAAFPEPVGIRRESEADVVNLPPPAIPPAASPVGEPRGAGSSDARWSSEVADRAGMRRSDDETAGPGSLAG